MFPKYISDIFEEGLEETWVRESRWAARTSGWEYYETHLQVIRNRETAFPIFRRLLGDGGRRILEAGCGTGRWMALFREFGNTVFGVDHSMEQLRFAKARAPEFGLAAADVLSVPFRASTFDAVFSSYVAEHFRAGPGAALREAHRVLKPGGLLFLAVPFAGPWRRLVVHPFMRLVYFLWERVWRRGLHFTEYHFRRRELEEMLAECGFEPIEAHPDDYRAPWSKGLWCDVSDALNFVNRDLRRPFEFGKLGTLAVRIASLFPLWWYCEGILVVARRAK